MQIKVKEEFKPFQLSPKDVGSDGIVICFLSVHIQKLTEHMKDNKKDLSSLRGLKQKVADRKKRMARYQKIDPSKHSQLKKLLKLR